MNAKRKFLFGSSQSTIVGLTSFLILCQICILLIGSIPLAQSVNNMTKNSEPMPQAANSLVWGSFQQDHNLSYNSYINHYYDQTIVEDVFWQTNQSLQVLNATAGIMNISETTKVNSTLSKYLPIKNSAFSFLVNNESNEAYNLSSYYPIAFLGGWEHNYPKSDVLEIIPQEISIAAEINREFNITYLDQISLTLGNYEIPVHEYLSTSVFEVACKSG